MKDLDYYKESKMSKSTTKILLPSIEVQRSQIGMTSNVENPKYDYQHDMKFIYELIEIVL